MQKLVPNIGQQLKETYSPSVQETAKATPVQQIETPSEAQAKQVEQSLPEAERLTMVRDASELYVNLYAVSDRSFTIFKGANGTFYTQFRDLKSGEVTTIPEPEMLQFQARIRSVAAAGLSLEA
jgi:hypothetical protein